MAATNVCIYAKPRGAPKFSPALVWIETFYYLAASIKVSNSFNERCFHINLYLRDKYMILQNLKQRVGYNP